jgi:hypothetical protein
MRSLNFSIYIILPAWVYSASNRNEYQESSWGIKHDLHVNLTTIPPSLSPRYGGFPYKIKIFEAIV